MTKTDNLPFFEDSITYLQNMLANLAKPISFKLLVIKEESSEKTHVEMGGIFAQRFNETEWQKKIDNIILIGASGTDIAAALAPANKGTEPERLIVAKISFRQDNLMGEMDFVCEYSGQALMKEFIMTQYNLRHGDKPHKLIEISATWESGIRLVGNSIADFNREPEFFINDRILKHLVATK